MGHSVYCRWCKYSHDSFEVSEIMRKWFIGYILCRLLSAVSVGWRVSIFRWQMHGLIASVERHGGVLTCPWVRTDSQSALVCTQQIKRWQSAEGTVNWRIFGLFFIRSRQFEWHQDSTKYMHVYCVRINEGGNALASVRIHVRLSHSVRPSTCFHSLFLTD